MNKFVSLVIYSLVANSSVIATKEKKIPEKREILGGLINLGYTPGSDIIAGINLPINLIHIGTNGVQSPVKGLPSAIGVAPGISLDSGAGVSYNSNSPDTTNLVTTNELTPGINFSIANPLPSSLSTTSGTNLTSGTAIFSGISLPVSTGIITGGDLSSQLSPQPVAVPVDRLVPVPVPIERFVPVTVNRPVPVPVDRPVPVPVERPVAVPVDRPVAVAVPVDRPVTVPIDRHVPVSIDRHVPIPVDRPVAVPVPRPIPVPVPSPYPVPVIKKVFVPVPHPYTIAKPLRLPVSNHPISGYGPSEGYSAGPRFGHGTYDYSLLSERCNGNAFKVYTTDPVGLRTTSELPSKGYYSRKYKINHNKD